MTNKCELCNTQFNYDGSWENQNLCINCEIALFQLEESVQLYVKGEAPGWLRKAMIHFGWIFESYPLTAAYLNLGTEILFDFVIGKETSLSDEDLEENHYLAATIDEVKDVLSDAFMIEIQNDLILPGKLTKEIDKIRLEQYNLNTDEFQEKVQEVRGVLSVALTLAIINSGKYRPQRPLALFRILGQNIINSGLDQNTAIKKKMGETSFLDGCLAINDRQKRRIIWHMSGFSTGHTRIIEDIDDDMNLVFDSDILIYMDRMRERYRERLRARVRS